MRSIGGLSRYFRWSGVENDGTVTIAPAVVFLDIPDAGNGSETRSSSIDRILGRYGHWAVSFWFLAPDVIIPGSIIHTQPASGFSREFEVSVEADGDIVFNEGGFTKSRTAAAAQIVPGEWNLIYVWRMRQSESVGGYGVFVSTAGGTQIDDYGTYSMVEPQEYGTPLGAEWAVGRRVPLLVTSGAEGAEGAVSGLLILEHESRVSPASSIEAHAYHEQWFSNLLSGIEPFRLPCVTGLNGFYWDLEGLGSSERERFSRYEPDDVTATVIDGSTPLRRIVDPSNSAVHEPPILNLSGGLTLFGDLAAFESRAPGGSLSASGELTISIASKANSGVLDLSGTLVIRRDARAVVDPVFVGVEAPAAAPSASIHAICQVSPVIIGCELPAPYTGPRLNSTVTVDPVFFGASSSPVASSGRLSIRITPDPVDIGLLLPAPTVVVDAGDSITLNQGYIFSENALTETKTDRQLADVVGARFTIIRAIRQGNPDWQFKAILERFCVAFQLSVNQVRGAYHAREARLNRIASIGQSDRSGYLGLKDRPSVTKEIATGEPYTSVWLASPGYYSAPSSSGPLLVSAILHGPYAWRTYIEVTGGALLVTLDGRECSPASYDLLIGDPNGVPGTGTGSGGEFRIDEFEPNLDNALSGEDRERFSLFGFARPAGAIPTGEVYRSGPIRVRPEAIRVCAVSAGVTIKVAFERVGDIAFG